MATLQTDTPEQAAARRRSVRNTTLYLAVFAVVVYVGFIVAFIHRHS